VHAAFEPEMRHLLAQRCARRTFPGDHQQRLGHAREHPLKDLHQEADVLLVRDAPDVGDQRALRVDAGAGAERAAVAGAEAIRREPGRQHVDGSADPVASQHRAHRLRRRDQGLHGRAL